MNKKNGRTKTVVNGLYTPEQRKRRDASRWTLVQGILAPLQFIAFLVSLCLVLKFLVTGTGYFEASVSIIVKTFFLYTIMITGALWERDVFGQYLFAKGFFWEDVVSMVVIALHTLYLVALPGDWLSATQLMWLALLAYFTYVINAAQFVYKFRLARKGRSLARSAAPAARSGAGKGQLQNFPHASAANRKSNANAQANYGRRLGFIKITEVKV